MYLDKLLDEDFVNLINLCNTSEINDGDGVEHKDSVDLALISDEKDRVLINGERYFWIRGVRRGDIPKFLGEFKATDYWMASADGAKDYSIILRKYMTRKFGEEYVESLYNYRLGQASIEADELLAYLAACKESNPNRG